MAMRAPAGFISAFFDPLKNPNAPTIGTATEGDTTASVTFTAPANVGGSAISAYYAVSNPDQITATSATSPVSVTGLTNGTAYTFNVWALNSYGPGPWSAASNSVTPLANPNRGLFFAGYDNSNVIDYINITSTGNASDFGDFINDYSYLAACASTTRAICGGGQYTVASIGYVTIATTGNATSFGNLSVGRGDLAACSNSTRGIFGGGNNGGATYYNLLDYVTIASTGNATTFGYLTVGRKQLSSCSSPTRGLWLGGWDQSTGTYYNIIDYVTIATTGNATDFGDLTSTRARGASCSSSTRGLVGGGTNGSTTSSIVYITIASTGNSTTFGNLTNFGPRLDIAACSTETRGVFGSGSNTNTDYTNVMEYVTIASTGNAVDFGDLTVAKVGRGATSSNGGGLQ